VRLSEGCATSVKCEIETLCNCARIGLSSGDGSPCNKSGDGGDIIFILLARVLIMFLNVSSSS